MCINSGEISIQIVAHFWVICLFIIKILKNSSYTLDILLYPIHDAQYFLPLFGRSLRSLEGAHEAQLVHRKAVKLIWFSVAPCVRLPIWKLLPDPRSQKCSPMCSSRSSFLSLHLGLSSTLSSFLFGGGGLLHSLHVDVCLSHNHLWKRLFFAPLNYLVLLAFVYRSHIL